MIALDTKAHVLHSSTCLLLVHPSPLIILLCCLWNVNLLVQRRWIFITPPHFKNLLHHYNKSFYCTFHPFALHRPPVTCATPATSTASRIATFWSNRDTGSGGRAKDCLPRQHHRPPRHPSLPPACHLEASDPSNK